MQECGSRGATWQAGTRGVWRGRRRIAATLLLVVGTVTGADVDPGSHGDAQARLLAELARDFRATRRLTGVAGMSPRVEAAMRAVPRHAFVQPGHEALAYVNRPLSIGHGQTISQPFIVALMSELAAVSPGENVLEIGTGSGYQAAVLAELTDRVYTIEIVRPLAVEARERLRRLGYTHVTTRIGDGNLGWPEQAPFDAIVVTAAGRVPPALVDQLAPGGRLVIPVDVPDGGQELVVITRDEQGRLERRPVLPVRFVPLTGGN